MSNPGVLKPLDFIGSSREDLKEFPDEVKQDIGYALFEAQKGEQSEAAKSLKGFGGAGVLEIIERFDGDTYRAVYTVKFRKVSMCCTAFKRSPRAALRRRSRILT